MTGGYSLIDCFDVNITSEPVKIEGIFKKYQTSKRKAFLLSNVTISNTQLNDVFSTPYVEDEKVCFPAYDGVIKISDTDYVTFESTADKYLSKEEFLTIDSDNAPYVSRSARDGLVKISQLVGGTVAWNQIVKNGDFSDGTNNWEKSVSASTITLSASDNILTVEKTYSQSGGAVQKGDYIANHVYLCFTDAKKVSGNSFIVRFLGNTSVSTITSEEWIRLAKIIKPTESASDTNIVYYRYASSDTGTANIRNVNIIDLTQMFANNPAIADYVYSLEQATEGSGIAWLKSYGFFTKDYYDYDAGSLQSVCISGRKITALDGNERTYPIDNEELRGLFKLDANNKLYADGDIYKSSGNVTRNYETRAYQSGDESLTDAITDGTNTVVKLAAPTTETADPYINPQRSEGTEEFVDGLTRDVMIPVGNNSTYYKDELFNIIGEYIDSCDDAVIAMIPEGE